MNASHMLTFRGLFLGIPDTERRLATEGLGEGDLPSGVSVSSRIPAGVGVTVTLLRTVGLGAGPVKSADNILCERR